MNENKFVSKITSFDGTKGYKVLQYINGKVICEQFIAADEYKDFCEAIGVIPEPGNIEESKGEK